MTLDDAVKLAKAKWGEPGTARYSDYSYQGEPYWCKVGTQGLGSDPASFRCLGHGPTFEEAFQNAEASRE